MFSKTSCKDRNHPILRGSSDHTFFFLQKSWFFSIFNQFLHGFCGETEARGRPEVSNSYSLTSWPELIVVIHAKYIPPDTHAVNLLEDRAERTLSSTSRRLELQWYHFSEVETGGAQLWRVDETERVDQHRKYIDCQSRVPQVSIWNPPNQTKARVIQEAVRACARLRLTHARPDLYIATVLHARCLLTVVSQVPIINFCELFMSITSTIISACSVWLQLPLKFFHCFFSSIPFLLRLQGKLICGFCARFGLPDLDHCLQHIWCIWTHSSSWVGITSSFFDNRLSARKAMTILQAFWQLL